MKRLLIAVLFLTSTSALLASPANTSPRVFPAVAQVQTRGPVMRVHTLDDPSCGQTPEGMPSYCVYLCRYGVPWTDPTTGQQRVKCTPQHPSPPDGDGDICNSYYQCVWHDGPSYDCDYAGPTMSGCYFTSAASQPYCTACTSY